MKLIILMIGIFLAGCNAGEFTGIPGGHNEECINGVVYYGISHGAAPAFKQDGSLYLCNGDKE